MKSGCAVHVGDREADIYDLFVQPRRSNSQLLIRAEPNRKVQHELEYLIPPIEQALVLGQHTIELKRKPHRAARPSTIKVESSVMKQERSNVVLHFE